MRYYLDTAIWVALLDERHSAHAAAERVFGKAEGRIIVSFSHIVEMRGLGMAKEYEATAARLGCVGVKQDEGMRKAAYALNEKTGLGYGDCMHLYSAKKAGAVAVSPDRHWRELGRVVGVRVLRPEEVI